MPTTDEDAALQAIATLDTLSHEQQEAWQTINTIVFNGEPFVDVHELFSHYNILYFRKLLLPRVELLWSPRLTLYAHLCKPQTIYTQTNHSEKVALAYVNCPKTPPLANLHAYDSSLARLCYNTARAPTP
jgi:hypothetical protein